MVLVWFSDLKVISNALDRVLHRWVTELGSFACWVYPWVPQERKRAGERPSVFRVQCACVGCVCVRPRSAPAPRECAEPRFWVNWGDLNPGPLESKNKSLSLLLKRESVTLHFLSHKICKNNAIIFIFKIQLWVLLALKLYFKKHRNLREKLMKAFCFDIFRVMFYCIDNVSVEETVILEFRSVSVFYKYFFKIELQLCQANIMNWIKFVFEFTSCIFCCM